MAIVACKECARKVSDKAVCCPHCGVPIAGAAVRQPRRVKPWLYGLTGMLLLAWAALATLWLTGTLPVPKPLIGVFRIGSNPVRSGNAADKIVPPMPHGNAPATLVPKPVNSAVYRTSVEQLYQDYDANEVAIQSKIGNDPVRISGTVAEIHEDAGHPIVTLHTGSDNAADMVLTDNERPVAAQLAKDDAVEIQCNEIKRTAARLHGSGCALMLVDAGAKLVYLAVSLSGKAGNASVYVVGPMSRTACVANSDMIAMQLTGNSTTDRIRKSCAATASDNLAHEGCRLSSTMPAIPDLPSAHLWQYDCMAPDAGTLSGKATTSKVTSKSAHRREAAPTAVAAAVSPPIPASPDPAESGAAVIPEALSTVVAAGAQLSTEPVAVGPPAPKRESSAGAAGRSAPAAVDTRDEIGPPPPVAAAGSASTTPTPAPVVADDLAQVRTKDPQAADRIVSYCSKITSNATNAAVAARCRRDEMDAWTRLTVQNEFPTLDETSRRKCSDPPFPDSFVALESCAKYQLHLD
jgi:hypothetical protein